MRPLLFILISLGMLSCSSSKKIVSTKLNDSNAYQSLNDEDKMIMKELNTTVEKVVQAGGNINRGKAIIARANDFNLSDLTSKENIDWLSFQKNILIEVKGKSDKVVYIVSHYDKVDVNPVTLANNMLNGVLDPLISWSTSSDGAVDNATGVAVSMQLAKELAKANLNHTYRILLVGAEEAGLRGSRAHVARMKDSISDNLLYMINTDIIGLKKKQNCVSSNVSNGRLTALSLEVAKELDIDFGEGTMPAIACSDYAPFKKTSFLHDFSRSLQFNMIGAFLPQRSYFTKKKRTEVINFSSCDIMDAGDYIAGSLLIPVGSIHGPRDSIKLVDEKKLFEQFKLTFGLIKRVETLEEINITNEERLIVKN